MKLEVLADRAARWRMRIRSHWLARCALPVLGLGLLLLNWCPLAFAQRSPANPVVEAAAARLAPLSELPQPASERPRGLSLAELEQMALTMNPSLARAAARVGSARGNWVQVGLPPNPSVGYEGQQIGSGGLAEQHGVLFSQEVVRGGKLRLNRAVADREVAIAQQNFATQQQRVLTDVRSAYYQTLIAERQIVLVDDLIRISQESAKAADALFRAQEVGKADVLQAELEVENARIVAQNARNRVAAAWTSLAAVVGNAELKPQPLEGDPLAPPKIYEFDSTLDYLRAASPEIAAAQLDIQRARYALERAGVEPKPNLNFQGLVNVIDNGIGGRPDAGVALTMPVPLFNRNQGAIQSAQHELAAASQLVAQLELDLKNRLARVFEQYSNARGQVDRYRERILPVAQESLNLTRQRYNSGEVDYTALLTAQRTYAQTHLNFVEVIRTLRLAEVQIEGLLLSGSLQQRGGGGSDSSDGIESGSSGRAGPIGGVELFHR